MAYEIGQNATSSQKNNGGYEISIKTAGQSGKFHFVNCSHCGRSNKIDLEMLAWLKEAQKVSQRELDKLLKDSIPQGTMQDEERYMNQKLKLMANLCCGVCKKPLAIGTGWLQDKEIDIMTAREYNDSILSLVDSLGKMPANRVSKSSITQKLQESQEYRKSHPKG